MLNPQSQSVNVDANDDVGVADDVSLPPSERAVASPSRSHLGERTDNNSPQTQVSGNSPQVRPTRNDSLQPNVLSIITPRLQG